MATRQAREAAIAQAVKLVRGGYMWIRQAQSLPYLHHTTLEIAPSEVKSTIEFYVEILGLELTNLNSPVDKSAWFKEGLHLYWGGDKKEFRGTILGRHVAFVVGDRYKEIVRKSAKLKLFVEEGTRYWGSPRCYIRDPGGNRIEIIEHPPPGP